ncbi:hypothetical protein HYQ46_007219 [Verticillium longisporum]|nr:hypothetical protein HYQ46_007219 [Verticillium longisporum]
MALVGCANVTAVLHTPRAGLSPFEDVEHLGCSPQQVPPIAPALLFMRLESWSSIGEDRFSWTEEGRCLVCIDSWAACEGKVFRQELL